MKRPRLLDTFCGAGGCSVGYHRAGFDVVGVDNRPQKNYPFEFHLGDALEFIAEHGREFDVIHASPPCQAYSTTKSLHDNEHPDLVGPTRTALRATGKPYIIENVPGAPLFNYVMLCGTMFGLGVIRHRLFECKPAIFFSPQSCNHAGKTAPSKGEYHSLDGYDFITCAGHNFQAGAGRKAMDIDWMTRDELAQAIPPAYTQYIGERLLRLLEID